jgi:hypothetical protein
VDFYTKRIRELKDGTLQLYPDFKVGRSQDLMVRGKSFYAVWDDEVGLWSTDEYDVQRLVDEDLREFADQHPEELQVLYLESFTTKTWSNFRSYMQNISDNSHTLDDKLVFENTEVTKKDYASKRLPYSLREGQSLRGTNLLVRYILRKSVQRSSGPSVRLCPVTQRRFRSSWSSMVLRVLVSRP